MHWIVRLSIANTLTAFHQVRYKAHYWALADLSNTVCCLSHYDVWFSRSDGGGGAKGPAQNQTYQSPLSETAWNRIKTLQAHGHKTCLISSVNEMKEDHIQCKQMTLSHNLGRIIPFQITSDATVTIAKHVNGR